ncbi:MAG TPA: response regulator [Dehalococcoidia bacterium]|nr:response regulator [Dehalococcoidia bacterium]
MSQSKLQTPAPGGPSTKTQASTGAAEPTPRRVVIVDDEAIIRIDLKEMLTGLGYVVVGEAADAPTGVELVRRVRPDLVVMDIKMTPEMDGIAAAENLFQDRIAPVVLLTAYSQDELIERAKEAGVVGYVVKPFKESDLRPVIEVAVARFRELRALEHEVASLKDLVETRKLMERAKGILMDTYGLKEAEAFKRIQRTAMNNRKTMKGVAESIILFHEAGRA